MNDIEALIRREIEAKGPMSAARFMELALYAPDLGYYETRREVGRRGDFYTSVSVGSLFGELLAFQFAQWIENLAIASEADLSEVQIVEAGAHDGQLASDILAWLREKRPSLWARLRYWILEPSSNRRAWQKKRLLPQFANVEWFPSLDELAARNVTGVLFSNELLDAMPVHRIGWNAAAQEWLEWRVNIRKTGFCWQSAALPSELRAWLPALPPELEAVLPDAFTLEISPQASHWWEQAARILRPGILMTVDYGFTDTEWIQPERAGGTLRSYRNHRVSGEIFDETGGQDITAHVNFSVLERAGERAGLKTVGLIRQEQFLTRIAAALQRDPGAMDWTPSRVRQFSTLSHPEHLGGRFRVLVQSKQAGGLNAMRITTSATALSVSLAHPIGEG